LLCIQKEDLEELFTDIPKLERFFRMITENMLIAMILSQILCKDYNR